jgi:hypothetical protein
VVVGVLVEGRDECEKVGGGGGGGPPPTFSHSSLPSTSTPTTTDPCV